MAGNKQMIVSCVELWTKTLCWVVLAFAEIASGADRFLVCENPIFLDVPKNGWYTLPPGVERIPVKPDKEAVYGLEFEIRGTTGMQIEPVYSPVRLSSYRRILQTAGLAHKILSCLGASQFAQKEFQRVNAFRQTLLLCIAI